MPSGAAPGLGFALGRGGLILRACHEDNPPQLAPGERGLLELAQALWHASPMTDDLPDDGLAPRTREVGISRFSPTLNRDGVNAQPSWAIRMPGQARWMLASAVAKRDTVPAFSLTRRIKALSGCSHFAKVPDAGERRPLMLAKVRGPALFSPGSARIRTEPNAPICKRAADTLSHLKA